MKPVRLLVGAALLAAPGLASAFTFVTSEKPMLATTKGWSVQPLVTIGETLPNGYQPVGILDGIGAFRLDRSTIRAFVNHELARTGGYAYSLANGHSLTGARISFFDIDVATRTIKDAGLAYSSIVDRAGKVVVGNGQLDGNALARLCSAALFEANSFGPGRGLADRLYFMGEETSNGTMFVLDPVTRTLHAAPFLGRGAWENATLVDTGTTDKVALILADDTSGYPMYLYVGTKSADPAAGVLERNGLVGGKLYVWKADAGDLNPSTFNGGFGDSRSGTWVEISNHDPMKAGTPGWDSLGFANQPTLLAQANAVGAFRFSRPEDVATNPMDGTLVAFASTGSGFAGGADSWGTTYTMKLAFDAAGNPTTADFTIIYNGNLDPQRTMRSPDNLGWSGSGKLLIQEDRAIAWNPAVNPNEAGILELDVATGQLRRIASIDRSAVPAGQIDSSPLDFGNWESSGILDISALFGLPLGRVFIGDVQAHSILLGSTNLVSGGQLWLLNSNVPEASTWAMLIAGFGLVGGAVRRRRPARVMA